MKGGTSWLFIKRRNGKWYFQLMIRGKRYHRGIQEATCKRDAEKAEAVFKAELLQGRYNLAENKGGMLFNKLAEVYVDYAKTNKISWQKDTSRVNKLVEFFGNKKLSEITPFLIESYRSQRKKTKVGAEKQLTNASVNRKTAILRKMLNIALDNDWITENSCSSNKVKPLREDNRRERYLSSEEEKRLLENCVNDYAYMRPVLICALHTGMRKGEILNMKWNCVDLSRGYIDIIRSKSGKVRKIPISSTLLTLLKQMSKNRASEYVFTNPKTKTEYDDIKKAWAKLCKRAGIEGLHFHDLRHPAATRMVASGIDLIVVQEILGHACITTTMRYSHPIPERKKDAVEALATFKDNNEQEKVIPLIAIS